MCRVIAVANQKGGVGKTTTAVNLGIGLVKMGKRVLLIDSDPQGSMTASLGFREPDELKVTLANVLTGIIEDKEITSEYGILHHEEGIDFLPGNIDLSTMEMTMNNIMSREIVLREYVEMQKKQYDYIIIDCMPSLGTLTINALVAADSVLIPVQAAYLPVKGLQQLIKTITMVTRRLNKNLKIEGILLTMVDFRTTYAREISDLLRATYGNTIYVFDSVVPSSVKASECTATGVSIYKYAKDNKVSIAYEEVTKEILSNE